MRITLVIGTLRSGGGAERTAANMANYWAGKGWQVTVLTTHFCDQSSRYGLDPRVRHLYLGSPRFNHLPADSNLSALLSGSMNSCSESERAVLAAEEAHI